jgi:hypothetical protein
MDFLCFSTTFFTLNIYFHELFTQLPGPKIKLDNLNLLFIPKDDEDDDEINVQDLEDENCRGNGLGLHHHQNGLTGLDGREYTPGELEEYQPR